MSNRLKIKPNKRQKLHDAIVKEYGKMIERFKDAKEGHYGINCYVCEDNHITKTDSIDQGVIPFVHKCAICGKPAYSTGYRDEAPDKEPEEEWYRPSLEETLKLDRASLDHVMNGGLLSRKRSKRPILNPSEEHEKGEYENSQDKR